MWFLEHENIRDNACSLPIQLEITIFVRNMTLSNNSANCSFNLLLYCKFLLLCNESVVLDRQASNYICQTNS